VIQLPLADKKSELQRHGAELQRAAVNLAATKGFFVIDEPKAAVNGARAKPPRWKRLLKRIAIVLTVLTLCAGYALKDHIRTLDSLRRIPGTNAYVMDYYIDYNMAEVRDHGIDVDHVEDSLIGVFCPRWIIPAIARLKSAYLDEPIATIPTGEHCSTVMLHTNSGHVFFGRNFDYKHDSCLILKVHGRNGQSSVAVLDLHYLNLDRDDLDRTSLIQRIPLLFAPYYLQDGMNEYGVAVSDMTVKNVRTPDDPAKPNIIHSAAMRIILDYAKSTDEAVELLKQYNIHFVAETCHLMIADATGKSIVVEFIDGQLKQTTTRENWQICTNHELCGKSEQENCQSCSRYKLASGELAGLHANADASDVMKVMQSVSKTDRTMWSSVYDLSSREFRIAYRQHYDNLYRDQIDCRD
jgi:penicillin V acylase-like amidase (Ntn superfamily)